MIDLLTALCSTEKFAFYIITAVVMRLTPVMVLVESNHPRCAAVMTSWGFASFVSDTFDVYDRGEQSGWVSRDQNEMVSQGFVGLYFGLAAWVIFRGV